MSGWPWKWSQGRPVDAGMYLICWFMPDKGSVEYAVHEWDGETWSALWIHQHPTHWQKVTSPAREMEMMNEYETT